jgi:uncharacterized hydrophobic protein (TIGR00271 family)
MDQDNRFRGWLSQYIQPLSRKRRQEITDYIRTAASPGFDYFFFVVLSGGIATLGLINDSPAVIIGAMVVAPLMSPILGVGMGSITADAKLARDSLSALVRGAVISILLSALLTLANVYLPFVPSLSEIPHEILTRTQPTPNDLLIALAGGLAAAYALAQPQLSAALPGVAIATALMPPLSVVGIGIALGRWDIAGGAALLFLTNAVTIAFAATLVFFLEGFSPKYKREDGKVPRSLTAAAILTTVLFVLLVFVGARSVTQAQENRLINNIIQTELHEMNDGELVELNINKTEQEIHLDLTVSSNVPPSYSDVVALQEVLVARLDKPVSLIVNYLRSERLDPLEPPTATPTATFTPTPGPTYTLTPIPTATATRQNTATPSPTPTNTPQPPFEFRTDLTSDYNLYFTPGGEVNAALTWNSVLFDLGQSQIYDGLVWRLLEDEQGRKGWYPEHYLQTLTATLTPTFTPTN